jgi:hypothetical protein
MVEGVVDSVGAAAALAAAVDFSRNAFVIDSQADQTRSMRLSDAKIPPDHIS